MLRERCDELSEGSAFLSENLENVEGRLIDLKEDDLLGVENVSAFLRGEELAGKITKHDAYFRTMISDKHNRTGRPPKNAPHLEAGEIRAGSASSRALMALRHAGVSRRPWPFN